MSVLVSENLIPESINPIVLHTEVTANGTTIIKSNSIKELVKKEKVSIIVNNLKKGFPQLTDETIKTIELIEDKQSIKSICLYKSKN